MRIVRPTVTDPVAYVAGSRSPQDSAIGSTLLPRARDQLNGFTGLLVVHNEVRLKQKFTVKLASRVKNLPPYLFATIDKMKQEAKAKGVDLIDLSIGDPDIPTPKHIIDAMKAAVENPEHHRYLSYEGMLSFRAAVADWYTRRFNVNLDPGTEVLSLIGSKEGIGHIPLAFVDPGDVVLVPSPGYPVYPVGTLFAGGESHFMPLVEQNDFLPPEIHSAGCAEEGTPHVYQLPEQPDLRVRSTGIL